MYKKYGIDKMIKSLDGEFAFVLYDKNEDKLIIEEIIWEYMVYLLELMMKKKL